MQLRNHHGAFANRRGDALDRTRANIAHREHAVLRGFVLHRRARLSQGIRETGADEALGVDGNRAILEPCGIRIRADEEET